MTLREQLDIIDGWLTDHPETQLGLVLSALRGPDNVSAGRKAALDDEWHRGGESLKARTTCNIRSAAFPRARTYGKTPFWSFRSKEDDYIEIGVRYVKRKQGWFPYVDYPNPQTLTHFERHIIEAARLLGIKVRYVGADITALP